jgi:S1-C subfamily serine protease
MYWAGTITYNTVNNRSNTVACYTDDLKWAIHLVRLRMGLHRANDEKFVSKTEHSAKTTKEQSKKSNQPISTGSGFFITKDGFFVTNNHVIEGGRSYKVLTADGLQSAELVQVDPQTDLALMRVKGTFKPIKFSMRKNEKLGASIATMGFHQPGIQGFSPKVTRGVISGETGFKGDVREYQIDASIQPGNSGGPLFNSSGELVGVVVATLRNGQVVNYAIKKAYLLAFLDSALKVSSGIIEGNTTTENFKFEEVVDDIRSSCALVLTYN